MRRSPDPRTVLAIAAVGGAMTFIDATIVNIAFPNIESSFHGTSIQTLSWVLNAYNIVFAAFLVAAGRLADLLGRRRLFVLGLELFTFSSLLCALAPSAGLLILFRVIQAFGAACVVPSSLALVLHAFAPARRAHGAALLSAVAAGAAGIGPSLGGLLVSAYDWRLVFLVNIPIGISTVLLARRHLLDSRAAGRRLIPDLTGALILAVAMGVLVLGVVQGQQWGWGSAPIIGSFVLAVLLLAAFVRRCSTHHAPIIDLALLRVGSVTTANVLTILAATGFYGYTLTNVLFLTRVWDYSAIGAGLALTPGPLIAMIVAGPSSRLAQRFGPRPVLVAGGLIWGAGVLWLATQMGLAPRFFESWLPGLVLLGIGAGITFPNLSAVAVSTAPGDRHATATSLNSVARQLGASVGVAVVVAIIGRPSPLTVLSTFHHAWLFGTTCLLTTGAGALLLGRLRLDAAESTATQPETEPGTATVLGPARPQVPRAGRTVSVTQERQLGPQSTAEFLAAVPIFAALDASAREQLAERARQRSLQANDWLFHQGDPGDETFVVSTGRLEVVDERTGSVIRELGRGDVIGELALLTGSTRSAGVRAARASELLAIDRRGFDALLESSPRLGVALARTLAAQLRDTRAAMTPGRPLPVTVALVGLDERVPLSELARGLREELDRHARTLLLHPGLLQAGAEANPASSVYAPALDRAEATAQLVVLEAGSADRADPWLEFCLAQADRILAVTSGGSDPGRELERHELRGCDLVAYGVRPGDGRLAGIAAQLDPVTCHSVSPAGVRADLARVARRLTGRSVGIALSGGGARAFSHIGVLDELLGAGVQIDRVAGVSMGAVVGGLFAMGHDPSTIDAICFEEFVQRRPLSDYTLPRHALIRGDRMRALLRRQFGTVLIEELPLGFMCGYAELRSAQLLMARHGSLCESVTFSVCLPVIGPPQVRGRDLYIDGSLVDNLPVAPLAALGEGPIVAVDVKASFGEPARRSPHPAQARRPPRTPSLGETVTRVLLLGSSRTSEETRRHANLVIKPRAEGVGLLEFQQIDTALEAGRAAAREALANAPAWLFGSSPAEGDDGRELVPAEGAAS